MPKSVRKIIALVLALSFMASVLAISAIAEEYDAYENYAVSSEALVEEDPPVTTEEDPSEELPVTAVEDPSVATGVTFAEFSGRVDELTGTEWTRVDHNAYTASGLTLRVTSGGDVVYAVVEGPNRDTQNVFYISIAGREGGFNFIGRPNVHYVVANGFIYRVLNDMTTVRSEMALPASNVNANANPNVPGPVMTYMPEWFGADNDPNRDAARLERIAMEHFRTWTGLRLRLDQIGNPDPADISISWRGMGTAPGPAGQVVVNLPTNTAELLPLTETFERYRPEGVYHPAEDYSIIFNPLRGGGSNLQSSEAPNCTCVDEQGNPLPDCRFAHIHTDAAGNPLIGTDGPIDGQFYGYAYITWRSLEPESGLFDWDNVRMYTKGDYPVVGPNMDQYQCARGHLVTRALEEFAAQGIYVQLRFVMDYPFGSPFGHWYGNNYVGGWFHNDPQGLNRSHTDLAMINLRNEAIADIPTWLINRMREEPNRPNAACPDNIPNRPDFDPGDGLYQRMRNPEDPNATFFARFLSGNFHCAIPNPAGGADLRICAAGCIPYRRPVGLGGNPNAAQAALGWHPNNYWGPEGTWYVTPPPQISGGVGLGPRYEHHLMLEYHERAINALAAEIARPGSVWNAVGNVQLGSLGRWGEWHNWPAEHTGTFPNAQLAYQFVLHYIEAFSCNDNIQIGMRYPNWILSRYNFAQFNDQTGHGGNLTYSNAMTGQNLSGNDAANLSGWPGHGGATGLGGNINANMANVQTFTGLNGTQYTQAARHPTHWMYGWVGGEYGDQSSPSNWFWQYVQFDVSRMGDLHRGGMHDYGLGTGSTRVHVMNTIDSFRWTHVSNLAPRGPNAGRTNATTGDMQRAHKNNDAAYDNMGYRFTLEEVEVTGELERGETVDVRMVINNRGVAPFYRSWPFEASFVDSNGNVVGRQIIEDVDITEWMPRHRPINNARPPATNFRLTANGARVYYRTFAELGAAGNVFIPANDGRTEVEFSVTVPANLSNAEYTLAIAILDPVLLQGEPGITFHNLGTRSDRRLVLEPFTVAAIFDGANPNRLADLLEDGDVILTTRGNLGIFAQHSPFVIPEGRTLYVQTTLNIQRGDVEFIIEGNLVVLPGGRVNNQGNGSTITVADGGRLIVNGWVENVTGSNFFNEGNVVVGSEGRFTVRASVNYCWDVCGDVRLYDGANVSIHRDATRRCAVVEPEPEE
ncbi:MAG: DUF4832 domain-containing protein [Oscillospiraceae bacterium]|nr:DUF4832 domain-containing protein [Oscillospiraceae bacterium]